MFFVDKKTRIENFPKLKRCDHSPKRDKFFYVSLDPPYFSLDRQGYADKLSIDPTLQSCLHGAPNC